jgi:carboxyvinyl-carboxyphosphonate phosphorylmutase
MFSGSIGLMSVLGAPDLVVLILTEFAGQAYRICRAGNLALLVDADRGYGNALSARRTVEELETAGICAMSIEDTVLPRPYGPNGKPSLSLVESALRQIRETIEELAPAPSARQTAKMLWSQ